MLKPGDTIKCHGAEDAADLHEELCRGGYEVEFEYEQDGIRGIWLRILGKEKAMARKIVYKTADEWRKEGERRFGKNPEDWKFICPSCGRVNTGREFKEAGAEPDSVYCECIGRHDKSKGCLWAAYGLLDICNAEVEGQPVFEFAEVEA